MTTETPDDRFLPTLKGALYAERKIRKAFPKMARMATIDPKLKAALSSNRDGTD
jgi:ferritin-like metal-binding protein YciE